jgi:hypothetical protein
MGRAVSISNALPTATATSFVESETGTAPGRDVVVFI